MSDIDDVEEYLLSEVATMAESETERMLGFVATLGAHRWGLDLERPPDEHEFSHIEDALRDAMDDLAAAGRIPMTGEAVISGACELLEIIEDIEGFDVHEPGPLAEKVGSEEAGR